MTNTKISNENKIYLLSVFEKPNLIKVGDTFRTVSKRNAETITNSSLHRNNVETYYEAVKYDGSMFRDKSLHKHLESAGYIRELNDQGNKSEWFYITQDEFEVEFEKFTAKPVFKGYGLRPAQQFLKDKLLDKFNNGENHVNMDACVRVGKSILSLDVAKTLGFMPVYLGKNLTSQKSVENDNAEFGIVTEMSTHSIHGVDDIDDEGLSDKSKRIIEDITESNMDNKKILFFVDEVDDASHTSKSIAVIAPVINHFKDNDMFGGFITMSGTRAYRGLKIQREVTDETIGEVSLAYFEMQKLQPENTCSRQFKSITYYSDSADDMTNISDSMKNKNHGHKSLGTTISHLLGTNEFDIKVDSEFPHYFIKFSTVGKGNANALVRFLNKNYSEIEGIDYVYSNINGDYTSSKESELYCKQIIDDNKGSTVVFVTQGMSTTSFSVTGIGTSIVFSDNELTADDIQGLHRSCTWKEGKETSNLILVTTNDSSELGLDDIFEDEIKSAGTRDDKIELYKQILHLNSITHYSVGDMNTVQVTVTERNVADILDKKMIRMTSISSFVQSLDDVIDEDELNFLVSGKIKSTSIKSVTAKGVSVDLDGNVVSSTSTEEKKTSGMTVKKKEKILRAFVENAVLVPAGARMMGVSVKGFDNWDEFDINADMFYTIYDTVPHFKDRIDMIYNLCDDGQYLLRNYVSKIVA